MWWPPKPSQSYASSSSTKKIRRFHLPSQLTVRAVLLCQPVPARFLRTKRPPRLPPPKALYQQLLVAANQIQTTTDKRTVLARILNIPTISTVMTRQWSVLAQVTLTLITPGCAKNFLRDQKTVRNLRKTSTNLSRCTRTPWQSSRGFTHQGISSPSLTSSTL